MIVPLSTDICKAREPQGFSRDFPRMEQFRFISKDRKGKWYDRLTLAQQHAAKAGVGFLDGSGNFVAYRGTILEIRHKTVSR